MGYSEDDSMVRVDFFDRAGRWCAREAVRWVAAPGKWGSGSAREEFIVSLRNHFAKNPDRLSDMDAVCLFPCHAFGYPLMIRAGGWRE